MQPLCLAHFVLGALEVANNAGQAGFNLHDYVAAVNARALVNQVFDFLGDSVESLRGECQVQKWNPDLPAPDLTFALGLYFHALILSRGVDYSARMLGPTIKTTASMSV